MMAHSMMMMNTHQGRSDMGKVKQTLIGMIDEGLKPTHQEVIDRMVEDYMKTPQYLKEHMDQEKKIANSLTSSDSSAKI